MTRNLLGALLVVLVAGAGCGGGSAAAGPPDINYGRDICVECGMIISEARFASGYRLPDGTEKVFDDIGGMLQHGHETGDIHTADAWVHDYETEEWVEAEHAHFIVTRSIATPMAFGIISFSDPARAGALAADLDADVVGWETILELPPEGLLSEHDDHDDHDEADH